MFNKMSIRLKLYAGFASILMLVAGLATFGYWSVSSSKNGFSQYRETARQSLGFVDVAQSIVGARLAVMKFRAQDNADALEGVVGAINELESANDHLHDMNISEEVEGQLEAVVADAQQYATDFESAFLLQEKRHELVKGQLSPTGVAVRRDLTEIMDSAYADGDITAAYYAGRAQSFLLLARYYAQEFLLYNAQESYDTFQSHIANTEESISTLLSELQNPVRREMATKAQGDLDTYVATFEQVVATIRDRNTLYEQSLDVIGPRIAEFALTSRQTQIDRQNTLGPALSADFNRQEIITIAVGGVIVMIGSVLAVLLAMGLSRPIQQITQSMRRLADDDTEIEVAGLARQDEIGDMAQAVEVFKVNAIERQRLTREADEAEQQRLALEELTAKSLEDLKVVVNGLLASVHEKADTMLNSARKLGELAANARGQAAEADDAASITSDSMQTVAAATDELTSSTMEIGRQVTSASNVVQTAATKTEVSVKEVKALSESGERIGAVVGLIQEIAEKTNLLALNATIEAARAGDAGRGFAVVASEVKALASQTAKATEEISDQVEGIQKSTSSTVVMIDEIAEISTELETVTQSIAASIEQQTAATQEISQTTGATSTATQELSANVSGVSDAIAVAKETSESVQEASESLAEYTNKLSNAVQDFYKAMRQGPYDRRTEGSDKNYTGEERRATAAPAEPLRATG